mgnify:CR=1 FL=1
MMKNRFSACSNCFWDYTAIRFIRLKVAKRALNFFLKTKPDAVFVDIKMPGMDGFEVLKQIKTKAPATEVILITGHGDKNLAQRALDMQADDFIHKPFQEEALTDALERLAQRQNQKPKK